VSKQLNTLVLTPGQKSTVTHQYVVKSDGYCYPLSNFSGHNRIAFVCHGPVTLRKARKSVFVCFKFEHRGSTKKCLKRSSLWGKGLP